MIKVQDPYNAVAWYKSNTINWQTFQYHVSETRLQVLASDIKGASAGVFNLCEDRYHFLVVFTASILEGRITVMPSNRSEGELRRITSKNKDLFLINDEKVENICQKNIGDLTNNFSWDINSVPHNMIAAELYTSGSTGTPTAHTKTWAQLLNGAQQICARFDLNLSSQASIIATVPPQHMFGFEMSVIMPLVCGAKIHHGQPFYPLDIQQALKDMPAPRILITTPTHLKGCIAIDNVWPKINKVISATSPLSIEVARQVENAMNTNADEIYGCSEIGAIATRRQTKKPGWELLPDYTLEIIDENAVIKVPAISLPVVLPDKLLLISDKCFRLIGRSSDMVKIGGKRGSVAELTAHMKSLKDVEDAIVFKRERNDGHRERLAALVVTKSATSEQLRNMLSTKIDLVFMPRPICIVDALPYTPTGKLPKSKLMDCLNTYLQMDSAC